MSNTKSILRDRFFVRISKSVNDIRKGNTNNLKIEQKKIGKFSISNENVFVSCYFFFQFTPLIFSNFSVSALTMLT